MKFLPLATTALTVTLLCAPPAFSQGAAPRQPSGGLFGATRSDIGGAGKLKFMGEVAQGLDSDLPVELGGGLGGSLRAGGFSTLFAASSDYARKIQRVQLAGSASTAFQYYQQLDRLDALSHSAGLGLGVPLPKRGRLEINEWAAYSPSYLYQLFPLADSPELGASIPSNPAYQIAQTDSYSYATQADLAFGSPRGTQLTTSGEYRVTHFERETSAPPDLVTQHAGILVSHAISRSGSFLFGYQYGTSEYEFQGRSKEHQATIGLEYQVGLSRSRRLAIRVTVSPAWLTNAESALNSSDAEQVNDGYLLKLQGDANVSYPFRLNWLAGVTYHRGVDYVAGLSKPLFSDSLRAELTGLITHRIDLAASAGFATAIEAVSDSPANLDSYLATIKIRYALKRSFALYSEYLYYYYDQRRVSRAPGLPGVFEQHSLRIGIALFVEALGRR